MEPGQADLLSMPREIRDKIYSYLLTSTYRVDTSPTFRYTQPLQPNGSIQAVWTSDCGETSEALYTFEQSSNRLGILRVNRLIMEETIKILYERSVFVFEFDASVYSAEVDFSSIKAIDSMKHIVIRVSEEKPLKLDDESYRMVDGQYVELYPWRKLFQQLAASTSMKETIVTHVLHSVYWPDAEHVTFGDDLRVLRFKTWEWWWEDIYHYQDRRIGMDCVAKKTYAVCPEEYYSDDAGKFLTWLHGPVIEQSPGNGTFRMKFYLWGGPDGGELLGRRLALKRLTDTQNEDLSGFETDDTRE